MLSTGTVPAGEETAAALSLDQDELVLEVFRLRLADAEPVSLERARFPADRFPGLLDRSLAGSIYDLLQADYGLRVGEAEERIEVVGRNGGRCPRARGACRRSPDLDRAHGLDGRRAGVRALARPLPRRPGAHHRPRPWPRRLVARRRRRGRRPLTREILAPAVAEHLISRDMPTHRRWDVDIEPVLHVEQGDLIVVETDDFAGGQIDRDSTSEDLRALDFDAIYPLAGPIFVAGAEPGDALAVEFLGFELPEWGWAAILPDLVCCRRASSTIRT